jgi:hypothetical protein
MHIKTRSELNAVTLNLVRKLTLGRNSKVNFENVPAVPGQNSATDSMQQHKLRRNLSRANGLSTTNCCGLESCVKLRMLSDNYQVTTLAAIKHRSDNAESVDDDDEIEWTEDPYEYKSQPADRFDSNTRAT